MTVARTVKLQRRRMVAAHIPELDYPFLGGWFVIGTINGALWVGALRLLGVL